MKYTLRPWRKASPTQLDKAMSCALKWWFEYPAGLRPARTAQQAAGTDAHDLVERFLLAGEAPVGSSPAALTAAALIEHVGYLGGLGTRLPRPDIGAGGEVGVELAFAGPEIAPGVVLNGRIDLFDARDSDVLDVIDFKTTSSFQWAKTAADLLDDVQLALYAYRLLTHEAREAGWVRLSLIYAERAKPGRRAPARSQRVQVMVGRDHVEARWTSLSAFAGELTRIATVPRPEDVPASPGEACRAYGSCPHQAYCPAYQEHAAALWRS